MLLVVLFWAGNFTAAKIAFDDGFAAPAFTARALHARRDHPLVHRPLG